MPRYATYPADNPKYPGMPYPQRLAAEAEERRQIVQEAVAAHPSFTAHDVALILAVLRVSTEHGGRS